MNSASRDYKTPRAGGSTRKSSGTMLLGIFIGLLLGLAIAGGLAIYMNKATLPFMNKSKPAEDPKKPAVVPQASNTPPVDKTRFDFYKILPGIEEAVPDKSRPTPVETPKAAGNKTDTRIQKTEVQPASASHEKFFIQAGAFPSAQDADNLKAKLALMGYDVGVSTAEIDGKGTWHRVRIGPFSKLEDTEKTKTALTQSGMAPTVIKVK